MDLWATKHTQIKVKTCESCEGTGAQVNEYGMIRMCPDCAVDHKVWMNQYGTDRAENPVFYVDEEKKAKVLVDKRKDYILLPNGEAVERLII